MNLSMMPFLHAISAKVNDTTTPSKNPGGCFQACRCGEWDFSIDGRNCELTKTTQSASSTRAGGMGAARNS